VVIASAIQIFIHLPGAADGSGVQGSGVCIYGYGTRPATKKPPVRTGSGLQNVSGGAAEVWSFAPIKKSHLGMKRLFYSSKGRWEVKING